MTWPPASLRLRLNDLRETVNAVTTLPRDSSDFTKVCLARYLTVRAAGYLEAVRDDAADIFVANQSLELIARRVRHGLRTGQGVSPSQLADFLRSFHPNWGTELEALLDRDDRMLRSQLGALVAARKKIAHGDGEAVTTARALQWATGAETIGQWIVKRFDPSRDPEGSIAH